MSTVGDEAVDHEMDLMRNAILNFIYVTTETT